MTTARSSLRRLLVNAALVAGGLIISILLAEVFIALFSPQQVLTTSAPGIFFVEYDEQTGWVNRPGASGGYSPATGIPPTRVEINRLGYRGREVPPVKPVDVKRILFLGDSNTFGYGVEEEERFSDILARSLPQNYQTINLGVFGYGTDQEALLLERSGLRFTPDVVVLGFSAGDLSDNMSSVNGGAAKPFCKFEGEGLTLRNVPVPVSSPLMKSDSRTSWTKGVLYRYSHLYRLVLSRVREANVYMRDSVLEMDENEGMRTTLGIIQGMDAVCRESGCRLVVFLISHGVWIDSLRKNPAVGVGYYPALKMALEQMGVPVIDTTPAFLLHHDKELFFRNDPVHLTSRGNEAAAEVLRGWLVKSGLLAQ
jgi:lysophospholipase L1-like esterase